MYAQIFISISTSQRRLRIKSLLPEIPQTTKFVTSLRSSNPNVESSEREQLLRVRYLGKPADRVCEGSEGEG